MTFYSPKKTGSLARLSWLAGRDRWGGVDLSEILSDRR